MQAKVIRKRYRYRRLAAPIGGVLVVLAIIGIVTVITASIRLTVNVLDNDREKEMFENIIRPVVMFNPVPFENPAAIDMMEMLRYCMWGALTGDKRGSYEYEDSTELIVPAADLDAAAARLFGPEIELVHQEFGDYTTRYTYSETDGVYYVPTSAQLYVYSPKVYEIVKDGEFFNLTVGYVLPENAWSINYSGDNEPIPEKYMIYVMRKAGDSYQIAKVQDMSVEEQPQYQGRS